MVAALPLDPKSSSSRPPLLPSEREINGFAEIRVSNSRKPRARAVPSRYMSPSSSSSSTSTTVTSSSNSSSSSSSSSVSRRFPSPLVASRNANNVTPKRSQSVDRRRSNGSEMLPGNRVLVTSTRSLSVSFQGEAFSLPISKKKEVNLGGNVRKATPERRRSTPVRGGKVDGNGVGEKVEKRWPGGTRQGNMLSRGFDCSNVEEKGVLGSSVVARSLRESLVDESRRVSFDGILNLESENGDGLGGVRGSGDANSVNGSSVPSDPTASDTESVSSGSTSGAQEGNGGAIGQSGPRGIGGSARFWQETNMRLRRLQDPGLGFSTSPTQKVTAAPKFSQSKKFSDGPVSSPRTMSSPIRAAIRAASPSKLMTPSASSPLRGLSPSRIRSSIGGSLNGGPWDTPSVLSFAVDVRRGKVGEGRIVDAHQLRLLYNRHLQWRYVNARADAALMVQRKSVEKNLWNAWITITALRDSVRYKRTQVQLLKQKLKLTSILKGQIAYLEEWSLLEQDHSGSLQSAMEALKASTLRLPVVGGATADIQSLKDAVASAIDVMQAMASSICSLLTKMEEVNSMTVELANVAGKERILLQRCKDMLSILATVQVKDCSLKTHVLQLNRSPIP